MPAFICETCGTQHADSAAPPERCAICEDERQYVGWAGQRWTTLAALRENHRNEIRAEAPGLIGIGTEPKFAIGQRALLVPHPTLPVLWDCVSLVDDASVAAVRAAGGARAIAVSHPHYYSAMVAWSEALGGVPVYLHEADRAWVMRPDPVIRYWNGDTLALADGLTLLRLGGHFEGAAVLHWAQGFERGALLTGDVIQVCEDRRWVSFMYSYPNLIPLDAATVRGIAEAVEPYAFDALCGAWWNKVIPSGAKHAVRRSAERYIARLSGRSL
ncbi:MAG: MBL fold metallo-hydrolase [Gemmatimonadales bacterium]